MSSVPDCVWVRGYVLNKLQDGPVRVADLIRFGEAEFGFSPAEIHAAGKHFAVIGEDRDGELVLGATRKPVRDLVELAARSSRPGESARQASGGSPA